MPSRTFDSNPQFGTVPASVGSRRRLRQIRRRRRKAVLGLGPRIALLCVSLVILAVAGYEFCSKIAQPYRMQSDQGRQIRLLNAQLASTDASNTNLQHKITYLKLPQGGETAARAQGWLKPGEVGLDVDAKASATPAKTQRPGFSGMIQQAWRNITGR